MYMPYLKKEGQILTINEIKMHDLKSERLQRRVLKRDPSLTLFPLSQYFTGLECGHKFCMQCWGDYLTTKIIEEGMGQVRSATARRRLHCCSESVNK